MPNRKGGAAAASAIVGATRGAIGAMAMTGLRTVTANLGLLEQTPSEAIVEQQGPAWVRRLDAGSRSALTELVHWSFGALFGGLYPRLPRRLRSSRWAGPMYGLAVQAVDVLPLDALHDLGQAPKRADIGVGVVEGVDGTLEADVVVEQRPCGVEVPGDAHREELLGDGAWRRSGTCGAS